MNPPVIPDDLVLRNGTGGRILLLVLDGLGGLPARPGAETELDAARTPHLDSLAERSSLGLFHPVAPGVTPGSGPGHLALFGYDPLRYLVGRGALSALGVGFPLQPGDLAVRLNLATLDGSGRVADRRAGRPSDAEGKKVVELVRERVKLERGVEYFLLHEKEHRAVLIMRGGELGPHLQDTDPQAEGVEPRPPLALDGESTRSSRLMTTFLAGAGEALADHPRVHGFLARGYASYQGFPAFRERFGLRGVAVAGYPMYRGVARLVGMEVPGEPTSLDAQVALLEQAGPESDFAFFHVKATDARGEDGDYDGKVAAIQAVDEILPRILSVGWDVVCITGDHSTPSTMKAHSWHPVPLLIHSSWVRPSADSFGENACRTGSLGSVRSTELMSLLLAHAGRMAKFGA
ncbi:MAG: 2,3-bisphosphoglycerate-independent phosphoglycerate mutase [Gemmatimonadota bacterium]